ncbi:MAG TPA: helix-turn-helix domain-containing protein [Alphaproteobacteria bacterium]|nr:helix-turn-helix domain-containing protein [Alphaproteobacteria bacterium]
MTLGVVSLALGISPSDILSSSRRAPAVYGRQLAMYLLNTIFRMKHTHIGRALGRDRTTATYACRVIEELRDDPSVEMLLGACEASLTGLRELAGDPAPKPRRRRINVPTSAPEAQAQ